MEIPYTTEARPDTGLFNAKLGIWLFLASEVMLFGALFSSYVLLRTSAPVWPLGRTEGLSVPLATVNTMVLIGSSVTMVLAWASRRVTFTCTTPITSSATSTTWWRRAPSSRCLRASTTGSRR